MGKVSEVYKILHHAKRQGWLSTVPALHRHSESKRRIVWIAREQADRLLDELPEHLSRMAEFALATGLRESNVRLLRWDQVDMARRQAWIEANEAKPGRALGVPLNDDALSVLARCRGDHRRYVFVWTDHDVRKGPVYNCSTLAWYKAVARAGLHGFRWHNLRHTWASWHVQAGTPLPVLQQLGG